MTWLAGAAALILTMALGGGIASIGRAAVLDTRVQLAADAAALAAIAEAAPTGGGELYLQARRFAEANGARLLDCICLAGEGAVQVRVAIDGAEASARAVIHPDLLAPAGIFATQGLRADMKVAVDRLLMEARGRVWVVSGYRSPDEQGRLWAEALAVYGDAERADDWVAPPGSSMHEKGLAVDLGGDIGLAGRLVASLGLPLHRPLANEPWHFELAGSRG